MKRSSRTYQDHQQRSKRSGNRHRSGYTRHVMNRFIRCSLIFLILVLIAAILIAGYASIYPVSFTFNTPFMSYQRESQIDYQVQLLGNDFNDQANLTMDQVYLQDFTRGFDILFNYRFHSSQASQLTYRYRIEALLKVLDAADPAKVLMTRPFTLLPEISGQTTGTDLHIQEKATVLLADYDQWITAFANQSSTQVSYVLSVALVVQTEMPLIGGPYRVTDTPTLLIPLKQQQFSLTRQLPESTPVRAWQNVRYQLVLSPVPFPVFPITAGLCFLLLVIIFATTTVRKKDHFQKKLRHMLHVARKQLVIIGDKAWEPEWCISASDFRSLVRTAKRLKHPIFCYIDRQSELPSAYFYVYFGENNYCFTFSSQHASKAALSEPPAPADHIEPPDEVNLSPGAGSDDSIPVLPETDDSPEVLLARLKAQTHPIR